MHAALHSLQQLQEGCWQCATSYSCQQSGLRGYCALLRADVGLQRCRCKCCPQTWDAQAVSGAEARYFAPQLDACMTQQHAPERTPSVCSGTSRASCTRAGWR